MLPFESTDTLRASPRIMSAREFTDHISGSLAKIEMEKNKSKPREGKDLFMRKECSGESNFA
jgi:hypothetical protein